MILFSTQCTVATIRILVRRLVKSKLKLLRYQKNPCMCIIIMESIVESKGVVLPPNEHIPSVHLVNFPPTGKYFIVLLFYFFSFIRPFSAVSFPSFLKIIELQIVWPFPISFLYGHFYCYLLCSCKTMPRFYYRVQRR